MTAQWTAVERFTMWLDNGCAAGNGESHEQQALFENDLRQILAVARLTMVVEPLVMTHLTDLVMDTPEDEALRHQIIDTLAPWTAAVQELRS